MDKNLLEFWGRALLNAAGNQQQMESMNKIIGQNLCADNTFLKSFFQIFSGQNRGQKDFEEIIDLTKKSSEVYTEFFKAFLPLFDVVSKEEHLNLVKENETLKLRIAELEKIIEGNKNLSGKVSFDQEHIVDNLTTIMKNQTQQFQDLMKQLNQLYKKETTAKKK